LTFQIIPSFFEISQSAVPLTYFYSPPGGDLAFHVPQDGKASQGFKGGDFLTETPSADVFIEKILPGPLLAFLACGTGPDSPQALL
jgi:hypothetical protein